MPADAPPQGFELEPPPEQMKGILRKPAMAGSNILSGFVSAMSPFAASALDPSGTGIGVSDEYRDLAPQMPGIAQQQAKDLANIPSLQPQGEFEKNIAAGSQGIGQAIPYLATGGGILPTLAAGAGGGIGGRYGEKVGAALGYPQTGSATGSFFGGLGGGTIGNLANKVYHAATSQFMPLGEAYKETGIPMIMTGDISGSKSLQTIQAGAAKALGGSGRTHEMAGEVLDAFKNSTEDTAAALGQSSTVQELGDKVQSAGKTWLDDFKTASSAAQKAADAAVGPTSPVTLSDTQRLLGQIKASAGGNPQAEAFLKSPLAGDIQGIIDAAPAGPWGGPNAPWSTVRAIRSRVGEYLENPALIADAGATQAKRIYGSLTTDLRGTAASNPTALAMFDAANKQTAAGHQFIENTLTPLMNKEAPQAAQSILSSLHSGDQTIGALRSEMPQIADEVAAFKLRDMAAATSGAQNAAGTAVSPGSFLTDWNKLAPEAKAALYQDPKIASKINALARVSESIKETAKMANTSGTAHQAALLSIGIPAAEGARQGYEVAGIPGLFAGGLAGGGLLPATGRGLSWLGANRALAPLLAARGNTLGPGQSGLLGILAGAKQPGLLGP